MPELPEVEVVRLGLAPAVDGATVIAVAVLDERSVRRHDGPGADFVGRLVGSRLRSPRRRGKFLWVPIAGDPSPDEALLVHLGMSGQVLLRPPGSPDERHTRIRIDLDHPAHGPLRVQFADQRLFGSMCLDPLVPAADAADDEAEMLPAQAAHIARDPLDPRFDDAAFITALTRRRTAVKRALLDQGLVSGIGNIYADEALWSARIHGEQPADSLTRASAARLLAEVRAVLARALAEGGTSFDQQYLNVNGQAGYFAHSLNAYGRQGQPCQRCGTPLVRASFMNRGSHFCPRCQRIR